ncbi:hypothetical protein [Actinomadura sp. 7K534]|uniref:hypothetical protein n=1 Tax=Actinomadura sp. 7K534 TaxID=2530366 RepID=UPI00105121FE|nr:hypothetical protein [Actinomadura sp. 7K534]TDB98846.1 hypothetical protein E1266_01705 [Actinomadura sp. 7K534]
MRSTFRPAAFDVMVMIVGGLLLGLVLTQLPQALRAADAEAGTPGVFTAESRSCISHPGHTSCSWQGRFRSDDGTSRRVDVGLYGDGPGVSPGDQVTARDIGRSGHVYMMSGSREWIMSALLGLLALFLLHRGGLFRMFRTDSGPVRSSEQPGDSRSDLQEDPQGSASA